MTRFVQAHSVGWTVPILDALRSGQWRAVSVRVPGVAKQTSALGQVIASQAFSVVVCARVLLDAWVGTLSRVARLLIRTLTVQLAADGSATREEGAALKTGQTLAVGAVTLRVADCIGAAGIVQQTGVDAAPFTTSLNIAALGVSLAANWKA